MVATAIRSDQSITGILSTVLSTYQGRKEAGICTRCDAAAGEDSNECPTHQAEIKKYRRRYWLKARRIWTQKKLCLRCGDKRRKGSKWCEPCLIKAGRLRALALDQQLDQSRDRTVEVIERDGFTRKRYVGQSRRGKPSRKRLDEQDLRDARANVDRALEAYAYASSAEVAAMGLVQRKAIDDAATHVVARATRHLGDVLARHGWQRPEFADYPDDPDTEDDDA